MRLTSLGDGTGKYTTKGTTESVLVGKTVDALQQTFAGGVVIKIHGGPFQRAGIPDIYFQYSGYTFWFEMKRPGGDTTALQKRTLEKLDAQGAFVGVFDDVFNVIAAVGGVTQCKPAKPV